MKRLLLVLLILAPLCSVAHAGEKPNTVLIHPGEVFYARFTQSGKKLKLVSATKELDEKAQVVLTMNTNKQDGVITLKLENKFAKDLLYNADMRSLTQKMHKQVTVLPVVTGKVSFEHFPPLVEELAVYGFELQM